MLYRTHRPILFSSSFFFTSLSSTSHHSHKKMERVEGALKSNSFSPDMSLKTTPSSYPHQNQPHALFHDSSAVNNPQNAAVLGDDFFVDDLLDFSNAVVEDPDDHMPQESLGNDVTTVTKAATSNVTSVTTFSVKDDDFGTLPASELSVPADDLESLEWLSNFVDDSCASYSLTCCPVIKLVPEPAKVKTEPEVLVQTKPCFTTPVQTKARSKRSRAGLPGWSLGSYSLSESSSSSTSSISTTTSSSSPTSLYYSSLPGQAHTAVALYGKQPVKKKHKKRPITTESSGGGGGGGHQQARRCSHCGVQKTPQWRAGPLGAKTLCNACGVRFKSGRLLPEYRPACSPTFSSELHSNNHRKVLEMRRQKEMEDTGLAGFAPPVQSF